MFLRLGHVRFTRRLRLHRLVRDNPSQTARCLDVQHLDVRFLASQYSSAPGQWVVRRVLVRRYVRANGVPCIQLGKAPPARVQSGSGPGFRRQARRVRVAVLVDQPEGLDSVTSLAE